ncbi:hypothetical protein LLEC1_03763 [Akanthomyces lecanii]|uniref:Defect at low temperature protein 1 n=1 Tax=Cordyceps confragosa TaxID=2714763 RepID=A0A179I1I3_CORDF|nr:hypothetical protein LLEC1_03763 [Akanthomyces lecanii]
MQRRRIVQRILYRSVYILFYLILIGLLLITPGDIIQRSIRNRQRYNILVLALVYAATILIIAFVYATRLYVNKTALAAIPKSWVPIDKGDVKERVYKMICAGLNRSAAITFLSRPRDKSVADENASRENLFAQPRVPIKTARTVGLELGVILPARGTNWADIEQPGWASPNSPDLPDLQYSTVLSELPNLIEAKALTLVPNDRTTTMMNAEKPQLDPDVVALLQRDPTMSLRSYLDNLAELGVIDTEEQTTGDFLTHRMSQSIHNDSSSSSDAVLPGRLPLPRRNSSFNAWSQESPYGCAVAQAQRQQPRDDGNAARHTHVHDTETARGSIVGAAALEFESAVKWLGKLTICDTPDDERGHVSASVHFIAASDDGPVTYSPIDGSVKNKKST